MDILVLRLDAPLMSFGAPIVDNRGITQDHPPLSLLVGLLGNALGYVHADADRLQRLQERILFAACRNVDGTHVTDFQTVDLGQDHLVDRGWTTRRHVERRAGGSAREATHIRTREYLADAVFTVALTLQPAAESPGVADVAAALRSPARPLFIGRKSCIPAEPVLLESTAGESLLAALQHAREPRLRTPRSDPSPAWWPAWLEDSAVSGQPSVPMAVTDERDWRNQIHGGQRLVSRGQLNTSKEGSDVS
jgi:CRISPR system Cascade subunit CasD